jgi:hypothetical protein
MLENRSLLMRASAGCAIERELFHLKDADSLGGGIDGSTHFDVIAEIVNNRWRVNYSEEGMLLLGEEDGGSTFLDARLGALGVSGFEGLGSGAGGRTLRIRKPAGPGDCGSLGAESTGQKNESSEQVQLHAVLTPA